MLFMLILMLLVGAALLALGWMIAKHERIQLLSVRTEGVSEKDKAPFCRRMGAATMLIGVGCAVTGVVFCATSESWSWLIFAGCFLVGLVMYLSAMRRFSARR